MYRKNPQHCYNIRFVRQRLVSLGSNDEPASVLFDKTRQEKEYLIKEKKIKRDKNASIIYHGEDNACFVRRFFSSKMSINEP